MINFLKRVSLFYGFVFVPNLMLGVSGVLAADLHFNTDTTIEYGTIVSPDTLYIDASMILQNHGTIQTNILVGNAYALYLRNTGVINSNFILNPGATLFQSVTNAQELKYIDFGVTEYVTDIESNDTLALSGILNVGQDATKIKIRNTKIKIDAMPVKTDVPIVLEGNVTFVLGDLDGIYDGVFLEYVTGNAIFETVQTNPLFADSGYLRNNMLYVKRVRETDYVKVFNNDLGRFLNMARASGKNDSFFSQLDSAMDMDSLRDVMNKSVLFNRDLLLKPLQIINSLDVADFDYDFDGAQGRLFGFMSDDFYAVGLNVNVGKSVSDRFNLYGGLRIGEIDYQSNFDMFNGELYGLNLGAKYLINIDSFVRANMALNIMNTDINAVMYDGQEIKAPYVTSGYINTDVGRSFVFDNGLVISPFVGAMLESYSIDSYSDFDVNMRAGSDLKFKTEFSGMKYIYSVRGAVNTNLDMLITGKIEFWSSLDGLGAGLSVAMSDAQDAMTYKISADARIAF